MGHGDVINMEGYVGEQNNENNNLFIDYTAILDSSDTNWFVTDISGYIIDCNEDFSLMFNGREESDLKGELIYNYINAKDLPVIVSLNSVLLQDAKKAEGLGPYRMISKDGRELLVIFKAIPIQNKDLKVDKILFSVNDITNVVEEMRKNEHLEKIDNDSEKVQYIEDLMARNA